MNVFKLTKMESSFVEVDKEDWVILIGCNDGENFLNVTSNSREFIMTFDYKMFIGHSDYRIETYYNEITKRINGKVFWNHD